MSLFDWLKPRGRAIQCPRCQSSGFEDRGPIKVVRDDGSSSTVGRLYGCPHCGLAFFTYDGAIKQFGHMRGVMGRHPDNFTPPTMSAKDEREPVPRRDTDQPWR